MERLKRRHDMRECEVAGCSEGLTGFRFPDDPFIRAKWVRFVKLKNATFTAPDKRSRICFKHFQSDDFINLGQYKANLAKRLILNKGAFPSIYQNSSEPARGIAAARTHQSIIREALRETALAVQSPPASASATTASTVDISTAILSARNTPAANSSTRGIPIAVLSAVNTPATIIFTTGDIPTAILSTVNTPTAFITTGKPPTAMLPAANTQPAIISAVDIPTAVLSAPNTPTAFKSAVDTLAAIKSETITSTAIESAASKSPAFNSVTSCLTALKSVVSSLARNKSATLASSASARTFTSETHQTRVVKSIKRKAAAAKPPPTLVKIAPRDRSLRQPSKLAKPKLTGRSIGHQTRKLLMFPRKRSAATQYCVKDFQQKEKTIKAGKKQQQEPMEEVLSVSVHEEYTGSEDEEYEPSL